MSDRLSLAHAIEDAGIPREKAENVATAIVRLVEGSVATKAELDRVETALKADLKTEVAALRTDITRLDGGLERLRATVAGMENRLLLRLGTGVAALLGLLFAALHAWPPH